MAQRSSWTLSGSTPCQAQRRWQRLAHSGTGRLTLRFALARVLASAALAFAQDPLPPPSLKTVPVPGPDNLSEFVADKAEAIRLGKALFWDMQVGSDGIVACASCHFHAGADSRSKNQLSPGLLNRDALGEPAPDHSFSLGGANYQLSADDFPLRQLTDPQQRESEALYDTNDVASSQGAFSAEFVDVVPGQPEDVVNPVPDPDGFQVDGINVRRVEPRHTPTVINAVFNHRNFWDGRAQHEFNGVNQWGTRDPNARLYKAPKPSQLVSVQILLRNSSLASQAVAPPTSPFEMSADGRSFQEIGDKLGKKQGKKVVKMRPLAKQQVHPEDSVLGALSRWPNPGLGVGNYEAMIKKAFRSEWWQSNRIIHVADDGTTTVITKQSSESTTNEYTLMEYNFSLFFGLAVQLYEATLVADETPYDRFMEGRGTLSPEALEGLAIFLRQVPLIMPDGTVKAAGRCINCHSGPEFTDAAVSNIQAQTETRTREGQDLDRGWNNIGVRPTMEDLAVGGMDPFGNPLSVTRLRPKSTRFIAVDGAFKVPTVRNVELTGPYFHNGGHLTLESVVQFYSRGGDFAPLIAADGMTEIRPLSIPTMTAAEQQAMIAFLKSLTDERVRNQQAPFDHPQLFVPNGHVGDDVAVVEDSARPGQALDQMLEIPAVGQRGGPPLPNFLESQ
jgi:cytochrome c peroxidase